MPPPLAGGAAATVRGAVVGGTGVAVGGTGVAVAVAVGDGVSVGEDVAVGDGEGVAVRVLPVVACDATCFVAEAAGEEVAKRTCAPLGDEQADATSTKARAARRMRDPGFHRLIVASRPA